VTPLALALVLASAVTHATWNLLAKRAGGGVPFVWLFTAVSAAVYAPLAAGAAWMTGTRLGPGELAFVAGSAVLHLGYFLLLQRGYREGDLSLVYPLARGTGPVLSTAAAVALLGERPSALALAGAALVAGGAFGLTLGGSALREGGARRAVAYGLLTGAFIAAYTLWDRQAVAGLRIPPLVYDGCGGVARTALLLPGVRGRWGEVRREWRVHRREVLGIALLSPLAYILVLTALATTPVSYVAPAREVSILFGTMMGTHLLDEGHATRRLAAAGVMVLGVAALAVG
jgi:drug/metabolite transporter (DMT)-like permease